MSKRTAHAVVKFFRLYDPDMIALAESSRERATSILLSTLSSPSLDVSCFACLPFLLALAMDDTALLLPLQ